MVPPQLPQEFLTVDEAAELLRLNRKSVYAYINETHPPWAHRFGRTIRISHDGLLAWARGNAAVLRSGVSE
jgi:excisionase family DNA binding protein